LHIKNYDLFTILYTSLHNKASRLCDKKNVSSPKNKNGKNRSAILTIFIFRRTDVKKEQIFSGVALPRH